ncbi:ABC transporter G family member 14-like [Patiria miniata]|uniref:ABC transporter domain-containing protein n=1 Tax=Patiria miniata TaxID=46514 RepID=A0A914AEH6_PATMI|nr:ABC transporter G family member 14-like [Patiria miniata]
MVKHGATLQFDNICLSVKNSTILHGVSGKAEPGKVLAIIGPSGSGKTTLLHVISGRLAELSFGTVSLNGTPLTKALRRRIALVLQDDIFFSNLTLRETLLFTARLRLPSSIPYKAKVQRVDEIVDTLDLNKCQDTRIGDYLRRGISGGEKKRANIACELLTDPAVLILDEPTSGLDSTTSLHLIQTLKTYAEKTHKTVVMSIHQPSSQIFHLFDHLLLLAEGQVIYIGEADHALNYFASLGLHCEPNFNPADFLIDKAKGSEEEMSILFEAAKKKSWGVVKLTSRGSQTPDWRRPRHLNQSLPDQSDAPLDEYFHIDTRHHHSVPPNQRMRPVHQSSPNFSQITTPTGRNICFSRLPPISGPSPLTPPESPNQSSSPERESSSPNRPRTVSGGSSSSDVGRRERRNTVVTISGVFGGYHNGVMSELSFSDSYKTPRFGKKQLKTRKVSTSSGNEENDPSPKWQTTFLDQLHTLTQRNFKQSRDILLSKFLIVKNILLAVVVGLLWFQTSHDETRINDIRGYFFFGLVYWGFESMFLIMNAFPAERTVVNKERLSGAYRLSAYYLAKMISELPLTLIMPTIYFIITYWMAGLNAHPVAFLSSWCAMLVNVLVGESIGLSISAYAPSIQEAVIIVSLYMLTTLILGGFYIEQLPVWLEWTSYLSYTFYFFTLQMQFEFGLYGEPVKCREVNSIFEACHQSPNVTHVDSVEVLDQVRLLPLSIQAICGIVVGFLVFFRLLGYVILRFIRTPV